MECNNIIGSLQGWEVHTLYKVLYTYTVLLNNCMHRYMWPSFSPPSPSLFLCSHPPSLSVSLCVPLPLPLCSPSPLSFSLSLILSVFPSPSLSLSLYLLFSLCSPPPPSLFSPVSLLTAHPTHSSFSNF